MTLSILLLCRLFGGFSSFVMPYDAARSRPERGVMSRRRAQPLHRQPPPSGSPPRGPHCYPPTCKQTGKRR